MNPNNNTTYRAIIKKIDQIITKQERYEIKRIFADYFLRKEMSNAEIDEFITKKIDIIYILIFEIGLGKSSILSFLFLELVDDKYLDIKQIEKDFKTKSITLLDGLSRIKTIYSRNAAIETENFSKLLLSMAEDIRVVLIMIAIRLHTMRNLTKYSEQEKVEIANESAALYAPLAHRMGLYTIKSELEDLSLKYTNREIYSEIAKKLNETKRSRDRYIAEFIEPLKEKMSEIGFPFEIKGRTKSIHSIYNKIKKSNTTFENIYDLFAIRIIFNTPLNREKSACWQAYSIVADMYQPNPKRLRDWLSIPKSNGYESLHTTVLGPENKWVEVQIRTDRMNEIAEKGLAAHWKYKGVKGESGMDEWLSNLREILENPELNAVDFMDEFKVNLYDKEVFVFTPNGDLHKLPKGATALDFAFSIHSKLGTQCVGAKVNNRHVQIKYVLNNGDQVEVLTSQTQRPNPSWLNIAITSKAKNKIRQSIKENDYKDANIGKELLIRRFKNWKIELDDSYFSKVSRKVGYKNVSDLYQAIAQEKLDIHEIRDIYLNLEKREKSSETEVKTADTYTKEPEIIPDDISKEDVLVIGDTLKNVDYKLAKCCNPVYGDKVFGFVSVSNGIKVHRENCPNAPQLFERFKYRIIKAKWSGKPIGTQYPITLRVIGKDDIGIVANITSIISREKDVNIRSISIDSTAGLFQGNLTIMVANNKQLEKVIKLINNVKGVKNVTRE